MMIDFERRLGLDQPRRVPLQPEKRLMLAVLECAVGDFQKYATAHDRRGRRLFAAADAWFRSRATQEPLDFENVCQALDLDPSFIRAGLRRWYVAKRHEPAPAAPFPANSYVLGSLG